MMAWHSCDQRVRRNVVTVSLYGMLLLLALGCAGNRNQPVATLPPDAVPNPTLSTAKPPSTSPIAAHSTTSTSAIPSTALQPGRASLVNPFQPQVVQAGGPVPSGNAIRVSAAMPAPNLQPS